jgi:hypothetical protein
MTRALKEAIIRAAAESQHAKDNGGGLNGYFTCLANESPELFVPLLAKLLVLQEKERANAAKAPGKPVKPAAYRTAAKVRAAPIRNVDMKGTPSSNVIDGHSKGKTLTIQTMTLLEQWAGDDLEEIVKHCWQSRSSLNIEQIRLLRRYGPSIGL